MAQKVVVQSVNCGVPVRLSYVNGECNVHARMLLTFKPDERKTLNFAVRVILPLECVCFVSAYMKHPASIPSIYVLSDIMIGDGLPYNLSITLVNTTKEQQQLIFDAPLATLKFVHTCPLEIEIKQRAFF